MLPSTTLFLGTTASLAIIHTFLGVDHTLPFVALARAREWSLTRTLFVTLLCGVGHVASSVVIGMVGIGLGITTESMLWLENARGELAASLLLGFGFAYAARAIWRRFRSPAPSQQRALHGVTPWALFIIFVLGPCEPLIPLMVVPGMQGDWLGVAAVIGVFGLLTIAVMMATVAAAYRGVGFITNYGFGSHGDVAAGLVVAASGAAVLWFGL